MIATSVLRLVLAAAIVAAGASLVPPAAAEAAGDCSVDTFTVDAKPVTVTLCPSALKLAADKTGVVTVTETIGGGGGGSFDRTSELDFFAGETTSRSIEDVPLAKIGIAKTLHLTIGYKGGAVHVEHALLVPGAIPLK